MGGLLGMMAARAYGDRLLETLLPGMMSTCSQDEDNSAGEDEDFSYRPGKRRRRYGRTYA
jgi:hypothetical protein